MMNKKLLIVFVLAGLLLITVNSVMIGATSTVPGECAYKHAVRYDLLERENLYSYIKVEGKKVFDYKFPCVPNVMGAGYTIGSSEKYTKRYNFYMKESTELKLCRTFTHLTEEMGGGTLFSITRAQWKWQKDACKDFTGENGVKVEQDLGKWPEPYYTSGVTDKCLVTAESARDIADKKMNSIVNGECTFLGAFPDIPGKPDWLFLPYGDKGGLAEWDRTPLKVTRELDNDEGTSVTLTYTGKAYPYCVKDLRTILKGIGKDVLTGGSGTSTIKAVIRVASEKLNTCVVPAHCEKLSGVEGECLLKSKCKKKNKDDVDDGHWTPTSRGDYGCRRFQVCCMNTDTLFK